MKKEVLREEGQGGRKEGRKVGRKEGKEEVVVFQLIRCSSALVSLPLLCQNVLQRSLQVLGKFLRDI